MTEPTVVAAFQRLQAGDAAGALEIARAVAVAQPRNARVRLAAGLALRGLGRLDEARAELEEATRLDPTDYAAAYELGLLHELRGEADAALAQYERATVLRPAFAPAQYATGAARLRRGDWLQAASAFEAVLALDARNAEARSALAKAHVNAGRACVSAGDFAKASTHFTAALPHDPANAELHMYVAQSDLLLGHWPSGWAAYRGRPTRIAFESLRAQEGDAYRVPTAEALRGRGVRIVGEQGLGDTLFLLRFASLVHGASRVDLVVDPRLHSILARSGIFTKLLPERSGPPPAGDVEVLCGDLPLVVRGGDPCPPSLSIAPEAERVQRWTKRLESLGPRPWIGVTWRAGTGKDVLAHGLLKTVPLEKLLAPLRGAGTVVSLQRSPTQQDLAEGSRILGAPLHDLAMANEDLEEALALLATLDRYVGVSNTNMHLMALAGKRAEVLVPFPYEWRWGIAGDSPWFPGWKVTRQAANGSWPS